MKTIHWLFRIIKDLVKKFKPVTYTNGNNYQLDPIYIMSFNIERDKPEKADWIDRRERIADKIFELAPNIICMQEVMPHQYKYLKNQLIDYNSYFTDTFTGGSKGLIISEGLSIFYSKDKYHLREQSFIRLSDKFGFKNENWRICQCIKLETKKVFDKPYTHEEIYVFNTHLDHLSKDARREGIRKILAKIKEIKQSKDYLPTKSKFFICGDFNAQIQDEEMSELVNWSYSYILEGTMVNRKKCIDYIFAQNVTPEYDCLRVIMSDHYPIIAKCK